MCIIIQHMRNFLLSLLLFALLAGAVWYGAGKLEGPEVAIASPKAVMGHASPLDVTVNAPPDRLDRLEIAVEQRDQSYPLFSLSNRGGATVTLEGNGTRVRGTVGRRNVPALTQAPARLVVRASLTVLFGLRAVDTVTTQDVEVRLVPPQIAVTSLHHFINLGGSEVILYRVKPADAVSGVRVGDIEYPSYPASGAGIPNADPSLRVAFFAVLYDQATDTPISVFARDAAGNEGQAAFDHRVFPKRFRSSRIQLQEGFMERVVPAILQNTPDFQVPNPNDVLDAFVTINRDLRRQNAEEIAALAQKTAPKILWQGPFKQMVNTAVESGFADHRTYFYQGKEVDQQVHLGFDLASLPHSPVLAANRGQVALARYLGIYGNCIVLDHGMGVQSLYGHLDTLDVKEGQMVDRDQQIGTTDVTGLAAGDHLHFTMLLHGHPVTPIDWWSSQWIEDRIVRKFREAGAKLPPT
ncbi:MAG: peptidoglycan DD-metalloendopeptidase family protein [Luteitalea sp.]|nr:peptidoglycan DD-metalloendopeptidase family protein [Luteitalea sp.]